MLRCSHFEMRSVNPWLSIILETCEERVGSSVFIKASRKLWSVENPASRMLWRACLSCEVFRVFSSSASRSLDCVCSCARCLAAYRIPANSSSVCFLKTRRFFSTGVNASTKLSDRMIGVDGMPLAVNEVTSGTGCCGRNGVRNGSLELL